MRIPIAREGYPFIAWFAAAGAGAGATGLVLHRAGLGLLGASCAAIAIACAGFFRDPEREVVQDPRAIVAPADGTVVSADEGSGGSRVSIFLSIFDVHVNRAPISGTVGAVTHTPGRFLAAFDVRSSDVNEQTRVPVSGVEGIVIVKQIAGLIARRIVCRVTEGDRLEAGQRIGLIRFGSRTDLIIPPGARLAVAKGEKVRAGVTIVGWWDSPLGSREKR